MLSETLLAATRLLLKKVKKYKNSPNIRQHLLGMTKIVKITMKIVLWISNAAMIKFHYQKEIRTR